MSFSSNNEITNNNANSNGGRGISLTDTKNNEITNNTINSNNSWGIFIASYGLGYVGFPLNNEITNNNISNNIGGIYFFSSLSNKLYLNNFINNVVNFYYSYKSTNTWNSPEEITYNYNGDTYTNYLGNYWDDYTESDADGDGIGDTPYSIDGDNDSYPLVQPFENYGVGPASVITQVWTSDSVRGPEVTEFPAGTETVHVNYEYENPVGSVQKIIWHDEEESFVRTATHVTEHESGVGTWSLTNTVFLSGGHYLANLFINDILLATVSWTVEPAAPVITCVWTSETFNGSEVVIFPVGTEKVYVNYDYVNPIGSLQKIICYDSVGTVIEIHTRVSEHRMGTGAWGLTYPGEQFWPGGYYWAELFINDILQETVDWTVQPPTLAGKVCIDPGHGGTDPGAVGWDGNAYPNEKDFTLDMALRLRDLLEGEGIEVVMTREEDVDVDRQARCDIANNNSCDIFVSIHCNSGVVSAQGTETFYYDHLDISNPEVGQAGYGLAYNIQRELVAEIGLKDRGTKADWEWCIDQYGNHYHLYVLSHTDMPAALTEVAFISNPTEFNLLSNPSFRQEAAQGIANGILRYFEESALTITTHSPVDIVVTDPDGLTISKQLNEIPGATYIETDIDGDGDIDDQVTIPDKKIGDYIITALPDSDALPTDMYTLEVSIFGTPIILADNVQISDIPSQGYIVRLTETGIMQIVPATLQIDHTKIDFKKKPDDDKVRVQGKFELDLVNGDGADISECVTVTVGSLSETITMVEKGKNGEKWEYKRPKDGEGNIKHMTIDWKKGEFDIRMDKADLTGVINPVTISIQIGDNFGEETILMREKKHHWDYKAHRH